MQVLNTELLLSNPLILHPAFLQQCFAWWQGQFLIVCVCFAFTENITNAQTDDETNKYLNNVSNNSNASPELIEYYDVDDVSTGPDAIYPDPDSIFNQKLPENHAFGESDSSARNAVHKNALIKSGLGSKNGATKFNKLQELSTPIDGIDDIKHIVDSFETTTTTESSDDGHFRGKSIDFNIRHSMEELRNEDLRDHDIIDNIMYIYYGSNVALRKSLGGSIIIVGTVFALAAQILAIIFTLLRNR